MKKSYSYTILRYVHDLVTGEFVNVGVALFSKEHGFLGCRCRKTYGRLTKMFPGVDGGTLTGRIRSIQTALNKEGKQLAEGFRVEEESVMSFATKVLPHDDSSLQWSPSGGGVTADPQATLNKLFDRMVSRYDEKNRPSGRNDGEVWNSYKRTLQAHGVMDRFQAKTIKGKDDEIVFEHAWQNGVWHCLEPVSLDLNSWDGIREKAYRHAGQFLNLQDASKDFKVYMLLGEPKRLDLKEKFEMAINILSKAPIEKEIIRERDAEAFSRRLKRQILKHDHAINAE